MTTNCRTGDSAPAHCSPGQTAIPRTTPADDPSCELEKSDFARKFAGCARDGPQPCFSRGDAQAMACDADGFPNSTMTCDVDVLQRPCQASLFRDVEVLGGVYFFAATVRALRPAW